MEEKSTLAPKLSHLFNVVSTFNDLLLRVFVVLSTLFLAAMRHRHGFKKLGTNHVHRKAILKNMAIALIKHERISTTLAKAKQIRKTGDKVCWWALNRVLPTWPQRHSSFIVTNDFALDDNSGKERHRAVKKNSMDLDESEFTVFG